MAYISYSVVQALGGPTRAAELIWGDPKKQSRVSNWTQRGKRQIPADAEVMAAIEKHTPYTRYDVRPDVYGPAAAVPTANSPPHSRVEAA